MRWLLLGTLLMAVALTPRVAVAQSRDASADALFHSAREAVARGDFRAACPRFVESQRLEPAPGTLLNVAQCEEKDGKLSAAYAHLGEVLAALPKDDFRVPYARERLAALKRRVPTVTISMPDPVPGARVLRDGLELREGAFGVPLPFDPGSHVLLVRADGHADGRQDVTVREGENVVITLKPGPTNSRPATYDTGVKASSGRRVLAFTSLGIGVAGVVAGTVAGLSFASAAKTYSDHCDASGCDGEGLAAASRAKSMNALSPIAFGVGALGLGTGAYLLLVPPSPRRAGVRVTPQVSPSAASLSLSGGF